jgi:hypothetical protein
MGESCTKFKPSHNRREGGLEQLGHGEDQVLPSPELLSPPDGV